MSGLPGTFANQRLDWKPGSHDLVWDRTITAVDAAAKQSRSTPPSPLPDRKIHGGGTIASRSEQPSHSRTSASKISPSRAPTTPTYPKDEEHSWIAIALNHVKTHGSATSPRVTSSAPPFVPTSVPGASPSKTAAAKPPSPKTGGYRRQAFLVYGQQVLVYRCHSEAGMNDFATGLLAAGPNVFLDCDATGSLGASGAFEGWAAGVLYERVHVPDSHIQLLLDQTRAQGAGWTAANSLIWNSTAKSVDAIGPSDGPNYDSRLPSTALRSQLKARGLHLPASLHAKALDEQATDFHRAN